MRWIERARRRRLRGVTFCDRCGQVCDAACRRRAAHDRREVTALLYGARR